MQRCVLTANSLFWSKAEFSRLTAQDRKDARKAQQPLSRFRSGKLRTISHSALKRELEV
jgi:hypothetical protein